MMTIKEYAKEYGRSSYEVRQVVVASSEPSQIRHTGDTWEKIFDAHLNQVTDYSATNTGSKKYMVDGRWV